MLKLLQWNTSERIWEIKIKRTFPVAKMQIFMCDIGVLKLMLFYFRCPSHLLGLKENIDRDHIVVLVL